MEAASARRAASCRKFYTMHTAILTCEHSCFFCGEHANEHMLFEH